MVSVCTVCCTFHEDGRCPGHLPATGPERHSWRAEIVDRRGNQTVGILLAPSNRIWRARILTYPNILWTIPGGGGTLKFQGRTAEQAEDRAVDFVRRHCISRKQTLIDPDAPIAAEHSSANVQPSLRKLRTMPVRFGREQLDTVGRTRNLSAEGMFVETTLPIDEGDPLRIDINIERAMLELHGMVMWSRIRAGSRQFPAGMGIRLLDPPEDYRAFVFNLPGPALAPRIDTQAG